MTVGIDHGTARFAVNSIRRLVGAGSADSATRRRDANDHADSGGSNGNRIREPELRTLADRTRRSRCVYTIAPRAVTPTPVRAPAVASAAQRARSPSAG